VKGIVDLINILGTAKNMQVKFDKRDKKRGVAVANPPLVDKSPPLVKQEGSRKGKAQVSIETEVKTVLPIIIKLIGELCKMYGMKHDASVSNTVEHWSMLCSQCENDWVKVCKYKFAAYFAYHVGDQTMPACPFDSELDSPEVLMGGYCGRWMRNLIRGLDSEQKAFKEKAWSFLTSISQLKKGAERPTERYLKDAIVSGKKELTTRPEDLKPVKLGKQNWSDLDSHNASLDYTITHDLCEVEVRRTVRELFKDVDYTFIERINAFWPSTKANSTTSGNYGGGSVREMLKYATKKGLRIPGGYLRSMKEEEENILSKSTVESKELMAVFGRLWLDMLDDAQNESPEIKPVALAEPLKVRVIGKGPWMTYCVLRTLWHKMHSTLRNHPTFRLLGETISEEIMLTQLGAGLKSDELFLSGDYASATNRLRSRYSNACADEIGHCLRLKEKEMTLFKRALTGHTIDGEKQENGQSMGSIVSFPVLNIINAALTRYAIELSEGKRMQLHNCRMLINGDDIAAKGNKDLYTYWKTITNFAGLTESLGKTYWSPKFVQMNSTNFVYTPEQKQNCSVYDTKKGWIVRDNPYKQAKYVNFGILLGKQRSTVERSESNDQSTNVGNVGARARELVRMAPTWLREICMQKFIEFNKSILEQGRSCPWYVAEIWGGLGLPGFVTIDNRDKKRDPLTIVHGPTDKDIMGVDYLRVNWGKVYNRHGGRLETKIPSSGQAIWETQELARKALPRAHLVPIASSNLIKNYEIATRVATINMLFDSNYSIETLLGLDERIEPEFWLINSEKKDIELYEEIRDLWTVKERVKRSSATKTVQKNGRIWSYMMKNQHLLDHRIVASEESKQAAISRSVGGKFGLGAVVLDLDNFKHRMVEFDPIEVLETNLLRKFNFPNLISFYEEGNSYEKLIRDERLKSSGDVKFPKRDTYENKFHWIEVQPKGFHPPLAAPIGREWKRREVEEEKKVEPKDVVFKQQIQGGFFGEEDPLLGWDSVENAPTQLKVLDLSSGKIYPYQERRKLEQRSKVSRNPGQKARDRATKKNVEFNPMIEGFNKDR